MTGMTQFGRALAELNIEILCANSSQAKGRVERANRTLQDRLVKELRLAGISNMETGNAFLPGFTERFNAKLTKAPSKPNDLNRALNIELDRLNEVFCLRDKRHVTKDLMLKYDRKRIKLEINDLTRGLIGKFVDIYQYGCGRIQVRANGVVLPHSILNPERRINHAAITENKRLSAVLAHIKPEQYKPAPKPKIKPVSANNGYVKTGATPTWGSVQDGAILRPQARRTRGKRSQPRLRYLRSTPSQAALPSAPKVTFLLYAIGDISALRLHVSSSLMFDLLAQRT
jgi:hypothetical protein